MNRIELIASLCEGSQCVCDIGCDHAYVLVQCLNKYNVKRGIAADVALGPLSAARDNISSSGLMERIDIVLSNGFQNIDIPFDTAVIAGMGGYLIRDILDASLSKVSEKKLILEPNTDRPFVRKYLMEHGFSIQEEYAIRDMGKYYEVMVAVPGNASYSEFELEFGPILLKKRPTEFIEQMKKKRELVLSVLKNVERPEARIQKEEELKKLERILQDGKVFY